MGTILERKLLIRIRIKISFDFDGTLTDRKYQDLALKFIENGIEVIIVTARPSYEDNYDLEDVAKRLGVETIRFTNYEDKTPFLLDCEIHFDDDDMVINDLNVHQGKCIGVLVNNRKYNLF